MEAAKQKNDDPQLLGPDTIEHLQAVVQDACAGVREAHALALQHWQGEAAAAARAAFARFDDTELAQYESELTRRIHKARDAK